MPDTEKTIDFEEPGREIALESSDIGETDSNHKDGKSRMSPDFLFGWIDDLVLYFVVFILIMSFLFRPVVVNGDSMNNTLYNGDVLILNGILYEPDYGDIIVVSRENVPDRPLIKRVIALENDVVTVDYTTDTVYVNGNPIDDEHAYTDPVLGFGSRTDTTVYPYTVPEGCVFVMGDHRGNSTDSREVGAIEYGQILGKVIFRVYRDTSEYEGSVFGPVD